MKRILTSVLFVGVFVLSAIAAEPPVGANDYLADCSKSTDLDWCKTMQRGFIDAWPAAWRGNYQGQRNVAHCFSTGCDGAVYPRKIEGCSWRMLIVARKDSSSDRSDILNYTQACAGPYILSTGRRPALDFAEKLYKTIYKREMPIERLIGY